MLEKRNEKERKEALPHQWIAKTRWAHEASRNKLVPKSIPITLNFFSGKDFSCKPEF